MPSLKRIWNGGIGRVKRSRELLAGNLIPLANTLISPHGVNLGGGNWRKLGWVNFDARHEQSQDTNVMLGAGSRLEFGDMSLGYVFSSHFFEHIDDETAQNLMQESYRVLKPGGVFRITVPDFEKTLARYHAGDHGFFDTVWGMEPRYENWVSAGVAPTLENKLSYAFFGYSNMDDKGLFPAWHHIPGYYCGPVDLPQADVREKAAALDIHALSDWFQAHKPAQVFDMGHINAYNLEKFRSMLTQAGFSSVSASSYRQSRAPELRGPEFDNRPEMSLFVEAVK